MKNSPSIQPRTTVVIPLFQSARFIDTIITNIDAMPTRGVEILISDRHCYDDTIDRLAERYAGDPRIRCIKHRDTLDWVGHINTLLDEAQGEYWRFLPHDDLSPPGSLEALIMALDANADAILAYGPTFAIDGEGLPLPGQVRSKPHPAEAEDGWTLGLVLQMFWKGYFNGAFKGLIRRKIVMDNRLHIRSTRAQIYPERCWLFALSLLGRFHFVREASYIKRFHDGSVHSRWKITGRNALSAARIMSGYMHDLLGPGPVCSYGTQDLWLNARRVARWRDVAAGPRPQYRPSPFVQGDLIRSLPLPLENVDGLADYTHSKNGENGEF